MHLAPDANMLSEFLIDVKVAEESRLARVRAMTPKVRHGIGVSHAVTIGKPMAATWDTIA